VVDGVQRRKLDWGRIMISRISETVVGLNRKCKRFCLQNIVGEWIRFAIIKEWLEGVEGVEGDLGVGKNLEIV
jgi:hypothetical protein